MPKSCCAVGCNNHNMMNPLTVTFHMFPSSNKERFDRWVNACKRVNDDGSRWLPSKHSVLCSAHFVTGKPSKDPDHPAYVPSLFSFNAAQSVDKGKKSLSRYLSACKRKISFQTPASKRAALQEIELNQQTSVDAATCTTDVQEDIPATTTDQATEFTSAPLTPESATVTRPLSPLSTTTPGQNAEIQPTEPDFLVIPWTPDLSHFDTEETTPQAISEDPVVECGATLSGLTQPMDDTERGALYDELYILRKEKEDLKGKISELENQLENVKLSASTVEGDDDKCKFYTGLSWDVFMTVFTYLSGFTRPSGSRVPMRDQLFLTLVKLRLDLPFEFMGTHAGVSKVRMGQIFWTWIDLMAEKMDFLVHWPDRETLTQTLPGIFKEKFPRLTCIIDCFEIFIDRPANLLARAQSYSNYKKHSTVKVFLGCTPLGSVSFLSAAWGGRVSDVELVRESGFIDPKFHLPGDQILADRGFTLQDDFAAACGAELIIPAFTKGRSQLSAQEVEVSRKISSVRIHVERVIGLLKNRYTILQGTLQIQVIKSLTDEVSEMARIDKLLRVCAGLTNLGEGIVYSESFSDEDEEEEVENMS